MLRSMKKRLNKKLIAELKENKDKDEDYEKCTCDCCGGEFNKKDGTFFDNENENFPGKNIDPGFSFENLGCNVVTKDKNGKEKNTFFKPEHMHLIGPFLRNN